MTDRPETMLAAVYHGQRDVRFETVPVPTAAPGELLLQVAAVGVCGTDAAEWSGGATQFPVDHEHPVTHHLGPLVIGHEFSGRVVDVGDGVDPSWVGKLVASCGAVPCGQCPPCRAGRTNQCRNYSAVGLHRSGALAAYVSTPVGSCLDASEYGLNPDEAALGQSMSIAVHVARRSRLESGDTAVLIGVGGIGAFLVHVLVQWGVRVVAVDLQPQRLQIARELGAHAVVQGGTDDDVAAIRGHSGLYPEAVLEVSGSIPGLRTAQALTPKGGRLVLVGVQKKPVEMVLHQITLQEQEIIGSNAMVREIDFPEALRLVAVRAGNWSVLAPRVLPLRDLVDGALAPMAQGQPPAIKTLIDPTATGARDLFSGVPFRTGEQPPVAAGAGPASDPLL